MFKGFLAGSLALIALYVAVQSGSSNKAEEASNVLVAGMRRLLSPNVAGLGAHGSIAKSSTTAKPAAAPTGTGIYFQNL